MDIKKFLKVSLLASILTISSYLPCNALAKSNSLENRLKDVKGNITLAKGNYNINYDITVEEDATLTIAAGTQINFGEKAGILSYGTLKATGTAKENIILSSKKHWQNITIIGESSNNSVLEYCVISNGSGRREVPRIEESESFNLGREKTKGGALLIVFSNPTIRNCKIANNSVEEHGGGIYLYKSAPIIQNNTITNNKAGQEGGGIFIYKSSPALEKNIITNNTAECGGGIYVSRSQVEIKNNTIKNNSASESAYNDIFPDSLQP